MLDGIRNGTSGEGTPAAGPSGHAHDVDGGLRIRGGRHLATGPGPAHSKAEMHATGRGRRGAGGGEQIPGQLLRGPGPRAPDHHEHDRDEGKDRTGTVGPAATTQGGHGRRAVQRRRTNAEPAVANGALQEGGGTPSRGPRTRRSRQGGGRQDEKGGGGTK